MSGMKAPREKFDPGAWQAQYGPAQSDGDGGSSEGAVQGYTGKGGQRISQQQFDIMMADEHKAVLKEQGLNPDGSPLAPEFEGIATDDGKSLQDQYQLHLKQLDPNTLEGYNMLKKLATEKGPSQYAKDANQLSAFQRQNMIEAGTAQAAGGNAAAQNNLAMRGGVSSGSRERLAMSGQRDLLNMGQGAYRQEAGSNMQTALQDEQMKRQALSQFGTAEGQIASSNLGIQNQETTTNTNNLIRNQGLGQEWNMDKYKSALDKWSAAQQADATRHSGGGGGK